MTEAELSRMAGWFPRLERAGKMCQTVEAESIEQSGADGVALIEEVRRLRAANLDLIAACRRARELVAAETASPIADVDDNLTEAGAPILAAMDAAIARAEGRTAGRDRGRTHGFPWGDAPGAGGNAARVPI